MKGAKFKRIINQVRLGEWSDDGGPALCAFDPQCELLRFSEL
jgi:hypothetical protein